MIRRDSRYVAAILYRDGEGEFLGSRQVQEFPPSADDRIHLVVAGDRLDALADRYLGRPDLWWVIADANGIFWPGELEVGRALRIAVWPG